jgi:methylamine---glutamate N-methyltransferase subunit A
MCGIAGIWYRDDEDGPLGSDLARMLSALAHRGRDGSGVALYGSTESAPRIVRHASGPSALLAENDVAEARGGHGIAHVRMATETTVDAGHAHPFAAASRPDVTLVHNGHVTNAERLRQKLEREGLMVSTHNDSEVIAAWIGERLDRGYELEDALRGAVGELDGTFSCLVATPDAMGVVRDRFAAKPLVISETPDWVAVTSEGRGLPASDGWRRREVGAGEVRVWRRSPR